MEQVLADRRDVDFILYEQLCADRLSAHDAYADFNRKTMGMVINEARQLAMKELLPLLRTGDAEGCVFENGSVKVPAAFHRIGELIRDGGWVAPSDDAQWGGQEMPHVLTQAVYNYFFAANYPALTYFTLTHGAGKLIERFGTDNQKAVYLKNMYAGKWGGTMLLTEPEAGSDVGALTTVAERNGDGNYHIIGSKIFITAGEHDLMENIVHPVLARIKGAPEGTRGISLFLVPKYHVTDNGVLGGRNDIVCTGIEEKMGLHGSATCSMSLGANGNCVGTLLGEENKGMAAMFVMMNEARLGVGMQGFGCASASYLNALNYARQRVQGKTLDPGPDGNGSVPIIRHPDVRQMLMTMKTYTDGMRSLLYYTAFLEDLIRTGHDPDEKKRLQGRIDILIPLAKGYVTDRSFDVCSLGVMVFGGYGYTKEYPQEQLLRDCKITQIYEGTNGIQAMDLLGRKMVLEDGALFNDLLDQFRKEAAAAEKLENLSEIGQAFALAVESLSEIAAFLTRRAESRTTRAAAYAHATVFMEVLGDIVMAWMLLWRARLASSALIAGAGKKEISFYRGQILGARFFMKRMLPVTLGKMNAIKSLDDSAVTMEETAFCG